MRDTVHIRREGFGNDRYSHAHKVNHEISYQDMPQLCVEEFWATFCRHPHLRLLHIRPSGVFPVTGVPLIPRDFLFMYSSEPRLRQIPVKPRLPETGRTGSLTAPTRPGPASHGSWP